MTENRVGFLYNIASTLSTSKTSLKLLKSYYLMRCVELTNGIGLPAKQFSTKARCRHCCLEWARDTEVKVQHIKLSRRQRRKIRLHNKNNDEKNIYKELEQICTFCKQSTTTKLVKPVKEYIKLAPSNNEHNILKVINQKIKKPTKESKKPEVKKTENTVIKKGSIINVYSNALDVFSLKNEKNTLSSAIKEPARVIKNNKKKKDKYAGLCQKAVLASAKLKQKAVETQKPISQNKLSLFLKPSN